MNDSCASCATPGNPPRSGHAAKLPRPLRRRIWQAGFFALFILAPPLDLFRFDLTLGHFILFGQPWTLGLDPLLNGTGTPGQAVLNLILRGFLPLLGILLLFGYVSWRYGRLYCGWLCPHFSVVETLNNLLRRTIGKASLWDRKPLAPCRPDGRPVAVNRRNWLLLVPAVLLFALLWAVVLLTYLLPPAEIYHNLWHLSLTPNQARFIGVGTLLLSIEFMFARHLFCRYACAVGVFQSFVWMANKRAMVVSFDRQHADRCRGCDSLCEQECPMRLKPRTIKRRMFTCTECGQCLDACQQVQARRGQPSLLQWTAGQAAMQESDR